MHLPRDMKSMMRVFAIGAALMIGGAARAQGLQTGATDHAPAAVKYAEQMPVDQLPDKVRTTVLREAGTKDVEWVRKEGRTGGKVVYHAQLAGAGKVVTLTIAPSGKILSRSGTGMASRRPHKRVKK
ncbi:MAG TPA: hypothetical protein VL463_09640 [Kofleriaceae bacterium]|nr:hypothetical protein [Kofleriaceae bacterium]